MLVAAPAIALAKSNTLSGKATNGDDNATVSLKVKVNKKNVATKVSGVGYKNLNYSCFGMDPDAKPERSGTLPGSSKVSKGTSGGKSVYRFVIADANNENTVSGTLNKKGTKLTDGGLRIKFKDASGNSCGGQADFTAKKK
jgi:hypothetical protein